MIRIIDTETATFENNEVCEIASIVFNISEPRSPEYDLEHLVDPGVHISSEASAIHHITDADVAGKPKIGDVVHLHDADFLVAHNAKFDSEAVPELNGLWICTMKLAMHLYPDFKSHKLQFLRYELGLTPDLPEGLHPHRALFDIVVTGELFQHLGDKLNWDMEKMYEISHSPTLLTKIKFGKFKDEPIENWIHTSSGSSWAEWFIFKADNQDSDVLYTLKHHLGIK